LKFYIASSLKNKEKVSILANHLKENGFIHTYEWTLNSNVDTIEKLAQIGEFEKKAVIDSDFFILLLPGGFGSHTELGMATASDKRIYIYTETNDPFNPEKTTTFYHIEGMKKFVGDFEQFIEEVISLELRKIK
jgi:hypothetical protein